MTFTDLFGKEYKCNPNLIRLKVGNLEHLTDEMQDYIAKVIKTKYMNIIIGPTVYKQMKSHSKMILHADLDFCLNVLLDSRPYFYLKSKRQHKKCISRLQDLLTPNNIRWNYLQAEI